jgi:hypothetical protein
MSSWGKSGNEHELSELTASAIRMMDEDTQKGLLFAAIRGLSSTSFCRDKNNELSGDTTFSFRI